MAEGRMLKKNISDSDKLAELSSDSSRMVWDWILAHLDVDGRYTADLDLVKGRVFPKIRSMTKAKIWKCLLELNEVDLIILYKIKNDIYIQYQDFEKHQTLRKDREAKSKIPPYRKGSRIDPGLCQDISSLKLYLSKDKIIKKKAIPEQWKKWFEEFWDAYEYKIHRDVAEQAFFSLLKDGVKIEEIISATNGYHAFLNFQVNEKGFDQAKMHPSTFLRKNRWKTYLGLKEKPKL